MGLYGSMEGGLRRFLLRLRSRYRRVVRLLMLASGNGRVWQRLLIRARRKRVWREVAVHVDVDSILRSILHVCRDVRKTKTSTDAGTLAHIGDSWQVGGVAAAGGCSLRAAMLVLSRWRMRRGVLPRMFGRRATPAFCGAGWKDTTQANNKPRLASAAALQHYSIHFN